MLTEAGSRSGDDSSMNGTKKLPHMPDEGEDRHHREPGPHQRQHDRAQRLHRAGAVDPGGLLEAIGTPSMKFFVSQIANGSAVVAMNRIVPGASRSG